ncbi:hypothetical protein NB311A_12966 [Nitrobacter sp. Nb-311A]|nr:hypothetical protein NB311A_12966 [Nitrobacter sp. Nb-311A]MDR6306126.1 hypothetical protein [Nitrobacter vulgaris]
MVLPQPITNEVAWIQFKSRSPQAELDTMSGGFITTSVRSLFLYLSKRAESPQDA